jgi:Flp pilus assembly protein TadD
VDGSNGRGFAYRGRTAAGIRSAEVAMRRLVWVAGLAFAAGACVPAVQERVRDYNEDGNFLFQHGRYDYARDSFAAALALQPENPDLIYNVGQCYDRLGQVVQAERSYTECLQRNANHPECRHALTMLLLRQGRRDDAVRMVRDWLRSVQHTPAEAAALAEDGYLYAQAHQPVEALERFQQALELDAHSVRALTEMGRVYEELHYPDRALVLYQRALLVNAQQPEVVQRASLLRRQGIGSPRPDD